MKFFLKKISFKNLIFCCKILKMNYLGKFIFHFLLFSPIFISGSTKFLLFFLFFISSILIFFFFLKEFPPEEIKFPFMLFLIFFFFSIFSTIPLNQSLIKYLSPELFKIIKMLSINKNFSLSLSPIWTLRNLSFYVTAISIFLFSYVYFKDKNDKVYQFTKTMFLSVLFFSIYSFLLKFSDLKKYPFPSYIPNEWNFGLFSNENIFGAFASIGVPLGIFLFFYSIRKKKVTPGSWLFFLFGACFLIFLLFFSSAWGALYSTILSFIICLISRKPFAGFIFLLALIFFSILIYPYLSEDIKNSIKNRIYFDFLGIKIISLYPLFGVGAGAIPMASAIYQKAEKEIIVNKIHNDYIEAIASYGIISILFFLSIFFVVYKNFRFLKEKYTLRCGLMLSILTIAIHSFIDFPLQNFSILSYFLIILAYLSGMKSQEEMEKSKKIKKFICSLLIFSIIIQGLFLFEYLLLKKRGYSYFFPENSFEKIRKNSILGEKFLKFYPFYGAIWGELARAKEMEGDYEGAVYAIERALILHPTIANIHLYAAKLFFIIGNEEKYLNALTNALGLSINTTINPFPLEKEEKEKVILDSLKISYRHYGKKAFHFYSKAYYLLLNLNSKKIKNVLTDAVQKFPENSDFLFLLANEYFKDGNLNEAEEYNKKSFSVKKSAKNFLLFAKIYAKKNNFEEAKKFLLEGIDYLKNEKGLELNYFVEGAYALKEIDLGGAIEFLKKGYFIFPSASFSYYIGLFEEWRKNYIESEAWYKKCIYEDYRFKNAYLGLYRIYKMRNEKNEIENLRARVKILFPEDDFWKKWE